MSDENEVRCGRCGKLRGEHYLGEWCSHHEQDCDRFTPAATPQYRELGAYELIEAGDEMRLRSFPPRLCDSWSTIRAAGAAVGCKAGEKHLREYQFRRRVPQEVPDRHARARKVVEELLASWYRHTFVTLIQKYGGLK